jgi:hypothetical protein
MPVEKTLEMYYGRLFLRTMRPKYTLCGSSEDTFVFVVLR